MAEIGEKVRVRCVGTTDEGAVFGDGTASGEPFEFVIGTHATLPAFEKAVVDMVEGERRQVRIPAEQAYGVYDPSLIERIPAHQFSNAAALSAGSFIMLPTSQGAVRAKVCEVNNDMVVLDFNHELAGRDLSFDIEFLGIVREGLVESELHPAGCGCGCNRLKESLRHAVKA